MDWIHKFQLFLFDFDGLLVDTERLHYQAYIEMMATQGHRLTWSFSRFCEVAHLNSVAIKETLYADYPELSPDWATLYAEKKKAYLNLVTSGNIELMPGAQSLLNALEQANIRRCVATNSFRDQIELIRAQIPALQTIPHWVTREDYARPKPNPDAYLKAIELYGNPGDHIIGFEDSLRGLRALQATPALPILICSATHPLLQHVSPKVYRFDSLTAISL